MSDYISREAATGEPSDYVKRSDVIKMFTPQYAPALLDEVTKSMINRVPAADVRAVVHGEWIEKEIIRKPVIDDWQSARCSVCGRYHTTPYLYNFTEYPFCPRCGADMKGNENECADT